ncbi:MAG TPA: plastocyanin/azurin family copper-binding protein [Candidatus Acidoferrales bacterium]|nr:plastocyanin/azurin family copper-binding protein [Candidatus Acidoferrales bacterium]
MAIYRKAGNRWNSLITLLAGVAFLLSAAAAHAQQNWNAKVGGQNKDMGMQAVAFLPNELWIHAGDTVTWTFASDDIHTVTFLTVGQTYPFDFTQGCPPISTSGSSFDGSTCVSSAPSTSGQTFEVTFPRTGNYEIVCLIHSQMFGMIHVLDGSLPLPHDQAFYDKQAQEQEKALLADDDDADNGESTSHSMGSMLMARVVPLHTVVTGTGQIAATPGGQQSLSIMRFMPGTITIHTGDTVEWANLDPSTGHTITFGTEPADLFDPSCSPSPCSVKTDADGALHATISGPDQTVHSGAIVALYEDEAGVPQFAPFPPTRFRVTFTKAGTYPYECSFHDNLGMRGKVIVLP